MERNIIALRENEEVVAAAKRVTDTIPDNPEFQEAFKDYTKAMLNLVAKSCDSCRAKRASII